MSFNVSYNFEAIDSFSPTLKKIQSEFGRLKEAIKKANFTMRGFGKGMQKVGRGISLKVGVPLALLARSAIKTATDFEASMNMVRAVSRATGSDYARLKAQALDLGMKTQFSARQSAMGMKFLSLSGMRTNQILKAMPATLNLAASAQVDLGTAAHTVSNIMHAYGANAKDLNDINDVLVATFTHTNTTLNDLGMGMRRFGGTAKAIGMPIQDAAAAIGLLGQAGIPGQIAGRMLVQAFKNVLSPAGKTKAAIKALGLQFTNAHGKLLPLTTIIKELNAAQLTFTGYTTIFGTRAGPLLMAAFRGNTQAAKELVKQIYAAKGITKRVASTQMEGLPGATKRLAAAFEHVRIVMTEANAGLVTFTIDNMRKALLSISKLNPEVQQIIGNFWGFGIVLGPVLIGLGKLLVFFAFMKRLGMVPFLGKLGGALGSFAAAAILPIAVFQGIDLLYHKFKWAKKALDEFSNAGIAALTRFYNYAGKVFDGIIHIIMIVGNALRSFYKRGHVTMGGVAVHAPAPERRFPVKGVGAVAPAAVNYTAAPQTVASTLNIKVDDKNNIVKMIRGESDADQFNMAVGHNMLLSRY